GLTLVGVHGEVDRLRRLLRQEAPLHAGREARAAATAQVRGLHHLGDLLRLELAEGLPRRRVAAVLEIDVDPAEPRDVAAAEEQMLGHRSASIRRPGTCQRALRSSTSIARACASSKGSGWPVVSRTWTAGRRKKKLWTRKN